MPALTRDGLRQACEAPRTDDSGRTRPPRRPDRSSVDSHSGSTSQALNGLGSADSPNAGASRRHRRCWSLAPAGRPDNRSAHRTPALSATSLTSGGCVQVERRRSSVVLVAHLPRTSSDAALGPDCELERAAEAVPSDCRRPDAAPRLSCRSYGDIESSARRLEARDDVPRSVTSSVSPCLDPPQVDGQVLSQLSDTDSLPERHARSCSTW